MGGPSFHGRRGGLPDFMNGLRATLKGDTMNLVIELLVTDANPRIAADLRSELHALLSGKGLRCADVATFDASEDSRNALAAMSRSSASIRLHEVE